MHNFPDSDTILPSSKVNGRWMWHEIVEYYDSHLNVTLSELSRWSGWSIQDIKNLLLEVK